MFLVLTAGFAMDIRVAYRRPYIWGKSSGIWLNTLKFIPAIFALASLGFLTISYPLVAALGNADMANVVGCAPETIVSGARVRRVSIFRWHTPGRD